MAPETVETAGVFGTGAQARLQLEAAHLVRPFARALVWGRDPDKAAACAADLATRLGIEARAESDPARLVAQSQLVVTTTPARAPILMADWLHPGLHITAMGSDQAEKNELDPAVLARADSYACDRVSQAEALGELRSALAADAWTRGTPPELGAVVAGALPGRPSPDSVTVCDLTGTGAQDTAIATHALAACRALGAGAVTRA
jgi:ornithine cyclodeaminase